MVLVPVRRRMTVMQHDINQADNMTHARGANQLRLP